MRTKTDFIEIRKVNNARLVTYFISIGLSVILFFYVMISLPEEKGNGILWLLAICIFILLLTTLSAWLPKVRIYIDRETVEISEGISIKNEIDRVPINSIEKVRFQTYK